MTATALALLALVAAVLIVQCATVLRYASILRSSPRATSETDKLPKAAVVLSLRGVDPYFEEAIATLLDQNYLQYDVHVIVDHTGDDAWQAIEQARSSDLHQRMRVQVLKNPANTCSLKNSALIQAVHSLDDSYEVVAFFDGDVVPHRDWLRDMVGPLAEEGVGATTGNRWYSREQARWGSLVRYIWNVGAVVQMWLNRMVWAGSMAIKVQAIQESHLLDVWGRSMSTDSVVFSQMKRAGYSISFVPEAIMVNREEISLAKFVLWVGRQLMMARLYHPGWFLVVLQTLFIATMQLAAVAIVAGSLATGQWLPSVVAAATLVLYWSASCFFVGIVDRATSTRLARRAERAVPVSATVMLRLMPAMIVTNIVFPWAILMAMAQRQVVWRGITYSVKGPFQIEMAPYRPFRPTADEIRHGSVL